MAQDKIYGLPTVVERMLAFLMLGAWVYQITLAYQVARDFLAPGNPMLQIAFVAVIAALIGVIDVAVLRGLISITRWNRYTVYAAGVAALMLFAFFIVEIGRLNVVQNGSAIASELTAEYEKILQPILRKLEEERESEELRQKNEAVADLEKLASAARSAVDLEEAGGYRADVEATFRQHGIDFTFSRRRGMSTVVRQLRSIVDQKQAELSTLIAERDTLREKERRGRSEADAKIAEIRKTLVTMRTKDLTPETYRELIELQSEIGTKARELVHRHGITTEFEIPPVRSLFVVGVESAFRFDTTGLTLWLIAFATSFGPILFTLFLRAIIVHESENGKGEQAPAVARAA